MPVVQRPVKQRKPSPLEQFLNILRTGGYVAQAYEGLERGQFARKQAEREQKKGAAGTELTALALETYEQRTQATEEALAAQEEVGALEGFNEMLAAIPGDIGDPIFQMNALVAEQLRQRTDVLEPGSISLSRNIAIKDYLGDPGRYQRVRELMSQFLDIPIEQISDNLMITDYILPGILDANKVRALLESPESLRFATSFAAAQALGAPPGTPMEALALATFESETIQGEVVRRLAEEPERMAEMLMRRYYGNAFSTEFTYTDPATGALARGEIPWARWGDLTYSWYLTTQRLQNQDLEGALESYNDAVKSNTVWMFRELHGAASTAEAMAIAQGLPVRPELEEMLQRRQQASNVGVDLAIVEANPFIAQLRKFVETGELLGLNARGSQGDFEKLLRATNAFNAEAGAELYPTWLIQDHTSWALFRNYHDYLVDFGQEREGTPAPQPGVGQSGTEFMSGEQAVEMLIQQQISAYQLAQARGDEEARIRILELIGNIQTARGRSMEEIDLTLGRPQQ